MSHYDCKNCGAYGGIDWGFCDECTPPKYLAAKKTMAKISDSILAECQRDAYRLHGIKVKQNKEYVEALKYLQRMDKERNE